MDEEFLSEIIFHFSSELSSSKNFSVTLLGLTISAQRGTISLLSREMVQPSIDDASVHRGMKFSFFEQIEDFFVNHLDPKFSFPW